MYDLLARQLMTLVRPTALLCIVFLAFGRTASCQTDTPDPVQKDDSSYTFPYDVSRPAHMFELPGRMREISGLTVLDAERLAAVQDEEGDLFILSSADGAVIRRVRFGKDGDYEGVEQVGDTTYVLRSDARLYQVHDAGGNDLQARAYDTGISRRCNAEGLGYYAPRHSLLIACKDHAGKKRKGKKVVHAFDIVRKKLWENPALVVEGLDPSLQPTEGMVSRKLRKLLRKSGFRPSGIAIHPLDGHIYIVSSAGSIIGVFNEDGSLRSATRLDRTIFPQPEGIAFGLDGTMFVATEAGSGPARIGVFRYDSTVLINSDSTQATRP